MVFFEVDSIWFSAFFAFDLIWSNILLRWTWFAFAGCLCWFHLVSDFLAVDLIWSNDIFFCSWFGLIKRICFRDWFDWIERIFCCSSFDFFFSWSWFDVTNLFGFDLIWLNGLFVMRLIWFDLTVFFGSWFDSILIYLISFAVRLIWSNGFFHHRFDLLNGFILFWMIWFGLIYRLRLIWFDWLGLSAWIFAINLI